MQIGSAAQYAEEGFVFTQLKNTSDSSSFAAYIALFISEWGCLILALAGLGSITLIRRRFGFGFALLLFLGIYIFNIGAWVNYANRYALLLYLPLVILASGGLWVCMQWLSRKQSSWFIPGMVFLIILTLWIPVQSTFSALATFRLPDTRQVAYEWALENIPVNTYIAYDNYTPDFRAFSSLPYKFLEVPSYILLEYHPLKLRESKINYVITSFNLEDSGAVFSIDAKILQEFKKNYGLLKVFQAETGKTRGRTIWVYQEK